ITDLLPTRAHRKGEVSPNRSVPKPWGIWAIDCTSDNIETATTELLAVVETRMEKLREAASKYDGAELTVGIFWQPEGGQGGYSLSSDLVHRLSQLGTRIDFYFCYSVLFLCAVIHRTRPEELRSSRVTTIPSSR